MNRLLQQFGSLSGSRPEQPDRFYHSVLGLDDFHGNAGNLQRNAGFRNILKMIEDQAIQGFWPVEWKLQAEFAIQIAQQAASVHQPASVLLAAIGATLRRGMGGELANDFFQYVFEADQSKQFAIFVHDHADAALIFLEML